MLEESQGRERPNVASATTSNISAKEVVCASGARRFCVVSCLLVGSIWQQCDRDAMRRDAGKIDLPSDQNGSESHFEDLAFTAIDWPSLLYAEIFPNHKSQPI
jgi:hypothetical protein